MNWIKRWGGLALLVLIFLVACLLRVYRVDDVPPGLWHDEAFNGLDALRSLKTGGLRIFYAGTGGREPLVIWLQTISISLLGPTPLAVRLVPLAFGVATLPVFTILVEEMFHEEKGVRSLSLLGTAGLATSYWHVHFSRMGFRVVPFAFFVVLATYFFCRGWRTRKDRFYCLAGIVIGLSAYTYAPYRLLPVLFAGFFVIGTATELHSYMRQRKSGSSYIKFLNTGLFSWLKGFTIMGFLAMVVFLPIGTYFVTHPAAFTTHIADVSLFSPGLRRGEALDAVLSNVVAVARMFYDRGDLEWRHNLPGRPALDALCAFGFSAGLVVSVLRSRKPAYAFVLVWLVVMLLPTIFSAEAPNTMRAIGALPAVYILVAVGFVNIAEFLEKRVRRLDQAVYSAGLVVMLLCFSGFSTFRDYFTIWAQQRETYQVYDGDKVALARHIVQLGERADVYLPLELYAYPTILYLLDPYYPNATSIAYASGDKVMIPEVEAVCLVPVDEVPRGAFVLLRRESGTQGVAYTMSPLYGNKLDDFLAHAARKAEEGRKVLDWRGNELAVEIPIDEPAAFFSDDVMPDYAVGANLGSQVALVGFDLEPREAKAGEIFRLTVYWQGLNDMDTDYDVFVHLIDVSHRVWSQRDEQPMAGAFPTGLWRPGEIMPDFYEILIGPGTPPGKYIFEVGLYQKSTGKRLPVLDNDLKPVDDKVLLGPVNVADPTVVSEPAQYPMRLTLGTEIAILGYSLDREEIKAGEALRLTLYWKASGSIETDYTVFTHLIDGADRIWGQQDAQPQAGRNPTSFWYAGEVIRDEYTLVAESDIPVGEYYIETGMYEFSTGQRLPIMTAEGDYLGDRLLLGPVRVVE